MYKTYIREMNISVSDYYALYISVFNEPPSFQQIEIALRNSDFVVCIKDDEKAIGMGRLIGDGSIFYYIRDVAVLPEYQGMGIGRMVIESCIEYIKQNAPKDSKISLELMSAKGKENFYKKFGFSEHPNEDMGHGMMMSVLT